ncbi:hypothetical protein GGF32_004023 [Allomyces javanicus]|nr:hypothetical protein GGF32_004023 [Allomyces javanicus]
MFKGEWAESRQGTDTPIQIMTWHARDYSHLLGLLFELAQMLELKPLMLAVNRQLADMLEAQFRDLVTAEAVPAHQFSESDDDEAEPSGGAEGAAKSPDQVEQAVSVAAE